MNGKRKWIRRAELDASEEGRGLGGGKGG